jgi:hypothetical protein
MKNLVGNGQSTWWRNSYKFKRTVECQKLVKGTRFLNEDHILQQFQHSSEGGENINV